MLNLEKLTPEQKEYALYVQAIADGTIADLFTNSGVEHAKIVLATIFDRSKTDLRVFAKSLTSEVAKSDLYIDSLISFLAKGGQLKILVEQNKLIENPNLYDAFKFFKEKVIIKTTPKKFINSKTQAPIHFTIGDDSIYRLEKDIIEFKAIGSFKAKNTAKV